MKTFGWDLPPGCSQNDIDEHFKDHEPKYKVEWHNIETNQWELVGEFDDMDSAFECAASKIGASKIHDDVSIFEDDILIWDSTGFKQGIGRRL